MLFSNNRKQYLEDEAIDSYRSSEGQPCEEVIRESEEFVESEGASVNHKYPILFVDVNLGEDKVERLTVYEGDKAGDVAEEF